MIGGEDETHPKSVRLFKNKGNMTFDDTKCESDQEFELMVDTNGTIEYPVKIVAFSSVYNLRLADFYCITLSYLVLPSIHLFTYLSQS